MATVCVKILSHHLKADGTYNVKIRITHKMVKRYIDTEHFVTQKQLTKKLALKDPFIEQQLQTLLIKYRQEISKLDDKLEFMNADQIRDHLVGKDEAIDFIKFCDEHIKRLKNEGRGGTASNQMTVRNSLADYFQHQKVSVMMITSTMLTSYEHFLRGERELIRNNQNKDVTINKKGLSDAGLYNHMRDLRTLFNAARAKYNDEELGIVRVPHYPFKKYKIGSPPLTRKRNLESGLILRLINTKTEPNSRAELAKELFHLSFLLCGINAADLYHCSADNINYGRIEYNRAKTKARRRDKAFISINIPEKAQLLLGKYLGKLKDRYCSVNALDTALSKGMKALCKEAGLSGITFYWARHSFASIARNDCRFSKDDIALSLNHVDNGHSVTDIYIAKDWNIVDEVQEAVIATLTSKDKKPKKHKVRINEAEIKSNSDGRCIIRQLNPRTIKSS
jgi:integrase